ncbi:MAG: chlorite dismutase family protein [Polyangiaceae bacterium]|nr:chlorite dismutase family protein [Polyangiaceae bacterium]
MGSEKTDDGLVIDVTERSGAHGPGPVQEMDRRLFMQLLVYDCEQGLSASGAIAKLSKHASESDLPIVIYEDVNNPQGLGVLTWSDDPKHFVTRVRPALTVPALEHMRLRHDFTMLGRTYATGYEPDLNHWLIQRPIDTALNTAWPWAVWYPLRRSGAFEKVAPADRGKILREHAEIGKAYGKQDLAHDIRLACHGLDANDNEFVIGLSSHSLHPISHIVQTMRKTTQTSEYINQMGPFFVGHVAFRNG